jgi:exodeoxyribonuclease VIII
MQDLMVDIECMGKVPDAVIVQIGACYFDRYTGEVGKTFSGNISLLNTSGQFDGSTVLWWLEQSKKGNALSFLNNTETEEYVLSTFRYFANDAKRIWSHATFDFVLLQNALRRLSIPLLPYRSARDIRTLVDLAGNTNIRRTEGKSHDGLEDCLYQVKYCVECFNKLKGLVD